MSMLFKFRTVSIQFFRGLPGFLFELLKSQLSWQPVVVHSHNVPELSQSSLFYDKFYLLQLCLHPDPLVTDFVFP